MLELINFKLSMWKISLRIFRTNLYLLYLNWILLVSRVEEWSWDVKYGRHFSDRSYNGWLLAKLGGASASPFFVHNNVY
mgnify:CR=1 FL=1